MIYLPFRMVRRKRRPRRDPGRDSTMASDSGLRLHHELLLLALHDEKGSMRVSNPGILLGGGILAELLLEGRVALERGAKPSKDRIVPGDSRPLSDPLLDECLKKIRDAKRPKAPKDWVMKFSQVSGLRKRIATDLVRKGILRERRTRVLLLFPWTYFPTLDPSPERRIVERVREAIIGDGEVDERTAALVAIAAKTGGLKHVIDKRVLKERKERIEEISEDQLAASAVQGAVEAAQAAAAAAATAGS
jgi:hypothetical protein